MDEFNHPRTQKLLERIILPGALFLDHSHMMNFNINDSIQNSRPLCQQLTAAIVKRGAVLLMRTIQHHPRNTSIYQHVASFIGKLEARTGGSLIDNVSLLDCTKKDMKMNVVVTAALCLLAALVEGLLYIRLLLCRSFAYRFTGSL